MELKGSVVLVTGASSGIGLAAAKELGAQGAKVALAARSADRLEAAAQEIRAAGGQALAVRMDVTSERSVQEGLGELLARFGRLDAVVNNAGYPGRLSFWSQTDTAEMVALYDVHVFGTERVTRAALPHLLASKGTIMNVASTVAWVPMPTAAAYSSAKAAVVAFSDSLRAELSGTGVRVVVYAPPHTRNDSGDAWPLELPKTFEPQWVARSMASALRGGKDQYVVGGNAALLLLQRLSPSLAAGIMRRIGLGAARRLALPSGS